MTASTKSHPSDEPCPGGPGHAADSLARSATRGTTLADSIVERAGSHEIHRRLLDIWGRIEGDKYLTETIQALELAIAHDEPYWDLGCVLAAYVEMCVPSEYLEIGVRRGRSAVAVAAAHPDVDLYLFDMWHPDYAGVPNPGPQFVRAQLARVGHRGALHFVSGRSQETVPAFFADPSHPQTFSLITVDGDHRDPGARTDLDNVGGHLAPGAMLAFDDIAHPAYPTLHQTWRAFLSNFSSLVVRENVSDATGTAIAVSTPADIP